MANKKNQKGTSEKKENPNANEPITRQHVKRAKLLAKDVKRFLRYNDDLITEPNREKIAGLESDFESVIGKKETTQKELSASADVLTSTCEKSVKGYKSSAIRENVESFFVVLVIVMAVRTYFAQPFKIPTGSMQPTLNGVIAYPANDGYEEPSFVKKVVDKLWYGRSHVNWVADRDMVLRQTESNYYQKNHFLYFTRSHLISQDGESHFSAPGTIARINDLVKLPYGGKVKKGDVIARGYVDTGDQVFVDRFSYHWMKPKRGDVFVFNTRDIYGIQQNVSPKEGSQHYIKRCVGVPGDDLKWEQPKLFVNGKLAEEFGMQRVMSQVGDYAPGYTGKGSQKLNAKEYWAMGDNSDNSSDSRAWGIVPERNIIGRGLFVFLPFGHHFGRIR